MKETELKKTIVKNLRELKTELTKLKGTMNEQFIRGFIMGSEITAGVKLPSHWYEEIIKEVMED